MSLDRISAAGGTYFLEVTTAHTSKSFSMLQINTDAVFTTLTITDSAGSTHNALLTSDAWGQNLAGRTVSKGAIIAAPSGSWFSAITMSSGDAIGVITRNK
jgi:hypothetical protein